jgi:murein DD-endopeptidase MepM/ murein hydrolase activator NlpD
MRGFSSGRRTIGAWLVVLAAFGHAGALSAQTLRVAGVSEPTRPGDLLLLTVAAPSSVTAVTITAFGSVWPAIRVDPTTWRGVVGVDLDRVSGSYEVSVEAVTGSAEPATFRSDVQVAPRAFRRRELRVAPDYVNPPPDLMARITKEAQFLEAVYASSNGEAAWQEGFGRPVPGRANSSFGTRSVFNGEERSPHAGTDFLSGTGTPIHAPAGGRVVAARDLFFSGNTVIIDHGLGIFSMLAHMSRIDVHEGDVVSRDAVVGRVGATGRVTGPHLHWALRVGGARVDPLSALKLLPAPQ